MIDLDEINEMAKTFPDNGRVLLTFGSGRVSSVRDIQTDEHVCTMFCLIEIAKSAGWRILPPEDDEL